MKVIAVMKRNVETEDGGGAFEVIQVYLGDPAADVHSLSDVITLPAELFAEVANYVIEVYGEQDDDLGRLNGSHRHN